MFRNHRYAFAALAAAALVAGTGVKTALARETTAHRQDNVAMGEEQIKALLPLMDQNQDGKVSEQEYMKYMQAEFKRLNQDGRGDLDLKDLTRSQNRPASFVAVGK